MDEEKMFYKNDRSGILVNGAVRSGNRALFYSMGLEDEELKKPIIGIADSFSEMVPGHLHLRELAQDVHDGILEAGGIPREFGTIAVCDGLCQGHGGMRFLCLAVKLSRIQWRQWYRLINWMESS